MLLKLEIALLFTVFGSIFKVYKHANSFLSLVLRIVHSMSLNFDIFVFVRKSVCALNFSIFV